VEPKNNEECDTIGGKARETLILNMAQGDRHTKCVIQGEKKPMELSCRPSDIREDENPVPLPAGVGAGMRNQNKEAA
jgi:hypothetical protein